MIRFAVVGTNWITQRFVEAAIHSGKMKLVAVYSRSLDTAKQFAEHYKEAELFNDLEVLAKSDKIDAVYIASPNSLHVPQSLLFMRNKKHVICEKPCSSNFAEVKQLIQCAKEEGVVFFEAFKTAYLPNFEIIRQNLPKLGRLRKVFFNYCQYSSRYQRYLNGEKTNTFSPSFSNGSVMDIGFYCIASAVALFGKPKNVIATATLLDSGVDAEGNAILCYEGFDVVVCHSKVSNSHQDSEIQGEEGSLLIKQLSDCTEVILYTRDGLAEKISLAQNSNNMCYEAEAFVHLIQNREFNHLGLERAEITSAVLTEVRKQTKVIFPADK